MKYMTKLIDLHLKLENNENYKIIPVVDEKNYIYLQNLKSLNLDCDINDNNVIIISSFIQNFSLISNLETLQLSSPFYVKLLSNNVKYLTQLKLLKLAEKIMTNECDQENEEEKENDDLLDALNKSDYKFEEITKLTNLLELSLPYSIGKEISNLKKLKYLSICNLLNNNEDEFKRSVINLTNLEELKILGCISSFEMDKECNKLPYLWNFTLIHKSETNEYNKENKILDLSGKHITDEIFENIKISKCSNLNLSNNELTDKSLNKILDYIETYDYKVLIISEDYKGDYEQYINLTKNKFSSKGLIDFLSNKKSSLESIIVNCI